MCQSSWEFSGELVQLQIIVIQCYFSWGRGPHSSVRRELSARPHDLELVCSTVGLFVFSRSGASGKRCIHHVCSVYSVYSHLQTWLLLRLPRLLKTVCELNNLFQLGVQLYDFVREVVFMLN